MSWRTRALTRCSATPGRLVRRRNIRSLIPGWEPVLPAPPDAGTPHDRDSRGWFVFPAQITRNPFTTRKDASSPRRFATPPIRCAPRSPNPADQSGAGTKGRGAHRRAHLFQRSLAAVRLGCQPRPAGADPHHAVLFAVAGRNQPGHAGAREGQMLEIIQQQASRLHRLLGACNNTSRSPNPVREMEPGQLQSGRGYGRSPIFAVWSRTPAPPFEYAPFQLSWAPEIMLVQLFQNLISNGIKYRAAGSSRISISAEAVAAAPGLFRCGTTARESTPSIANTCSACSSGWTRGNRWEPEWVWRSARRWWSGWVAGSGSPIKRVREHWSALLTSQGGEGMSVPSGYCWRRTIPPTCG